MTLFHITDDEAAYQQLPSPKCWIQHGYIKASDFFSSEELIQLNAAAITLDFDAVELMNKELRNVLLRLSGRTFRANAAMKTRAAADVTYSLLFDTFKKLVTEKYFLQVMVQQVTNALASRGTFSLSFVLTDKMRLADSSLSENIPATYQYLPPAGMVMPLSQKKKWFYRLWRWKQALRFQQPAGKRRHVVLYLYDTPHYVTLLSRFFEAVRQRTDMHLSIVKITTGIEASRAADFSTLRGKNISVYDIADFRAVPFEGHGDLWDALETLDARYTVLRHYQSLDNLEVYYAWISASMQLLKPHSVLFLGHTDMGRAVSDSARLNQVRSVNAEYAFIFDAPIMDINICFDVRASIGQSSVDTWKKHGDPSPKNIPIGYLRFDEVPAPSNKTAFYQKYGLDPSRHTIFFASTWGAANKIHVKEKALIADDISRLCGEKGWNFIVKKHPSEADTVVADVIQRNGYPGQHCFAHEEINLNDAVAWSDLICTQSSSIVLEALYFEKPFCFVSYYGGRSLADYFPFDQEPALANLKSMDAFRTFAEQVIAAGQQASSADYSRLKKKFLFATDAGASERLLQVLCD